MLVSEEWFEHALLWERCALYDDNSHWSYRCRLHAEAALQRAVYWESLGA